MFPMSGVGFMGKKKAIGFRFLHDEISGGVEAYSKMKCQELYAGNCVAIPQNSTQYGFVDNILDFAQIDADLASNSSYRWYDQFRYPAGVMVNGSIGAYLKSANNFPYLQATVNDAPDSIYKDFSNPLTFYCVFEKHTVLAGNPIQYLCHNNIFQTRWQFIREFSATGKFTTQIQQENVNFLEVQVNSAKTTLGTYLYCVTYDGSLDASGIKIYINDMTTPEATTIIKNDTITAGINGITQRTFGNDINRNDEVHIFNSVHDSATRENVKQIFEQYYTFT